MSPRRIIALITVVLFLATVVSCLTSRKESQPGSLWFADNEQSGRRQRAQNGFVVVTHGWIEKGRGGWPEDMASAIYSRVGPNGWLCGYFDWAEGAKAFNATNAAEYARDVAGPKLAEEIIKTAGGWQHIHLIGHSSGCWAISEAAKILAKKTKADIHLTFLDAYVPVFWEESSLGDVDTAVDVNCWAEHYYTRDLTLGWTQYDLSFAHNVDITSIDGVLRDHNFPWQWYYATISGEYPEGSRKTVQTAERIEYGFARSLEAHGLGSWRRSLRLPMGNKAVKLKKR